MRNPDSSNARPLAAGLALAALMCSRLAAAQTIETVATFHNVGVEVRLETPPPDDAEIALAVRRADKGGPYRPAHPLSRIAVNRFAGSVVTLAAGTTYEIRLESDALDGDRVVTVTTRRDAFVRPIGRTLHVSAGKGADANDGLAPDRCLKSLRRALATARPGDTIVLYGGRYLEGDLAAPRSGTAEAPIVIRSTPGETAVLDGTDPAFQPAWTVFDQEAGVYRTPCAAKPTSAYLDGGQFFHYRAVADLVRKRWGQDCGYAVDGKHLYARFPKGSSPGRHKVTIPRFTTGITIDRKAHIHIIGIEFCYYGLGTYHRGIHLDGADHVLVDRCVFHHNGLGVTLKRGANFNTVQRCAFTESPLSTWSWHAVKTGGIGYEAGGVGIYTSDTPNRGNVIRHNVFRDMFDASGVCSGSLKGPTTNLDFHDNLVDTCSDDGIETDGASINLRIYRNVFRRFLTGISVAPCAPGPTYIFRNVLLDWRPVGEFGGYPFKFNVRSRLPIRWVHIYHNTCSTSVPDQDGFLFKQYSQWSDIVSRNNIYAGTAVGLHSWSKTNPVNFDYDLIHTANGPLVRWAGKSYDTLEAFALATRQEAHGLAAGPGLQAPSQGDCRLAPGSPCIDRGIVIPGFNDGFRGTAPDLGAIESPDPMLPAGGR